MSYSSRVYRQRNPKAKEEKNKKPQAGSGRENSKAIQTKLSVNEPGDQYEQEADSVASAVVNNTRNAGGPKAKGAGGIQRLSTPAEDEKLGTNDARMKRDKDIQEKPLMRKTDEPEKKEKKGIQKKDEPKKEEEKMKGAESIQKKGDPEKEKKGVQKKDDPKKEEEKDGAKAAVQKMDAPEKEKKEVQKKDDPKKEEEKPTVQRKAETGSPDAGSAVSDQLSRLEGKGKPLPESTLREMQAGFGRDFRDVRIHNDSEAAALSDDLQAQAFTHGRDIYFNSNKYDTSGSEGKFLLAHELTHVVQQTGAHATHSVSRQPAAPQHVSGIATPVPAGAVADKKGIYETTIGGVKFRILPDKRSRHKGKGAITRFTPGGGKISGVKAKKGKVVSFTGPTPVTLSIQTTYQASARGTDTSVYGRGTTAADITAGATSLAEHEGSHGTDFIQYVQSHPMPVFGGAVGMKTSDFRKALKDYGKAMKAYYRDMEHSSKMDTDCVGVSIDQATGSNVCTP